MRGVRGGWFIDDTIGLLWADDGLCYVSNDEGAKIVVVEVSKSAVVTKGRPANVRVRYRLERLGVADVVVAV